MSYISVLSLATIKTYLRIDDTQNETDSELTSMINSALSYIEKHTNVMLYDRDKDYLVIDNCARVYDFPINSVTTPASSSDYSIEQKHLYTNYTLSNPSATTLTLNVGYDDPVDIPPELIDLAKVIIKVMYYEQETNQSFKEMLPQWANEILNANRRFVL